MTKVEDKPLPHGNISFSDITNPQLKRSVMLLNENIMSLKRQLSEVQRAVIELQRR